MINRTIERRGGEKMTTINDRRSETCPQVLQDLLCTDEEAEMFAEQLADMIGFANKLNEAGYGTMLLQ